MYSKKLKAFLHRLHIIKRPKISLLIPFSSKEPIRVGHFEWLLKYWKHELPTAEIIIGKSKSKVFCKGEALNDAFHKSSGKILVILDADAYLSGKVIDQCATRMLDDLENNLWYVPYRNLYRLTSQITDLVIHSDPSNPYRIPSPPPPSFIENQGDVSKYGSRYGAMITMFPREAMNVLKCFDERFKGWGGEDISLLRALDTLYGKHKTTRNSVFHLWHPFIGDTHQNRMWDKQNAPNPNGDLASRYNAATRDVKKMTGLINESYVYYKKQNTKKK
jgi:glycosyltransferase involved in cell wall biosynthesis